MKQASETVYRDIAARTGGELYLGVVGPVRTGKSTFVKRFMELMVLPRIENVYRRERAKDELPQSGSGRTIMTSEPKFVPEEAVKITTDGTTDCLVRLIDSVGYMIPPALGAEEDGQPRMVTTPWYPEPIPMSEAAELGTKKIMDEHCSMGLIITTDGSIHDIPREAFVEAEMRAIQDMKSTGKPFLVLVNSTEPEGRSAKRICSELEERFQVRCVSMNCLTMEEDAVQDILDALLYEFPLLEMQLFLPSWMQVITVEHPVKEEIFRLFLSSAEGIQTLQQAESGLQKLMQCRFIRQLNIESVNPAAGIVICRPEIQPDLFYEILSERCGMTVSNDTQLFAMMSELAAVRLKYEKIADALHQVYATGYGIVMPTPDEMQLEVPQIVRKGSNYGVKLKASAPSIHMLRADIETEINPMVGDEKQSEDLLQYLQREYENDTEKLWDSNIFGKSVFELVNEGLTAKLRRLPDEARLKLQNTWSRIINEGSRGFLCLILS